MRTNGQIGYDAYRAKTGGVSIVTGQPIPEWKELRTEIQEAWEAAGEAIERSRVISLKGFSEMNRRRCEHHLGFNHPLMSWSGSDWFTAMFGEFGEAANKAKKLNRVRDGITGNTETTAELELGLRDELADGFIYYDLLCQFYGIDLAEAVLSKFERTSRRIGYVDPFPVEG